MTLTKAIMCVLMACDEPLTSYEVFEILPDIGRAIYPSQVRYTLMVLSKRGKIERISVNEKHGRNWVKSRYCLKE